MAATEEVVSSRSRPRAPQCTAWIEREFDPNAVWIVVQYAARGGSKRRGRREWVSDDPHIRRDPHGGDHLRYADIAIKNSLVSPTTVKKVARPRKEGYEALESRLHSF